MDDRLTRILELQRHVCEVLDVDPTQLAYAATLPGHAAALEQRRDRLLTWVTCCVDELHEALDESSWKRHTIGGRWDAEKMFGELRDALQFLIDLMFLATGLSAEQLADKLIEALRAKSTINLARKAAQDDGVSRRCVGCGRSTDELNVNGLAQCRPGWCAVYGDVAVEAR